MFATRNARAALFTAILLLRSTGTRAEVHTYECDVIPTDAGWTVGLNWCNPQEWVSDGKFFQHVDFCPGWDPPQGQQSSYEHSLANFVGTAEFWFEFVVVTDGDSSELIAVAPVSVLFGNNSVAYQVIISYDQVRFIPGSLALGEVYFDILPGERTFRVDLVGDVWYRLLVDGVIIDEGPPDPDQLTHPVLAEDSVVHFRTKAKFVESTAVYSYIRWGQLQPPGSLDFTMDGAVDHADAPFMQECLSTLAGEWAGCAWADADASGLVDCADWAAFLDAWTSPETPPIVRECVCGMADLNASNAVEANDLAILLGSWGTNPASDGDLSHDGMVNASDLALLLGAWGPCP